MRKFIYYIVLLTLQFITINIYAISAPLIDVDTCSVTIFQNDTTYYSTPTPFYIQLNASQGAYSYNWIPATGLSDPTIYNPMAQINGSIEYVLEAKYLGDNLVYNGDFELGNIGFTTEYNYTTTGSFVFGNYTLTNNANNVSGGFSACNNGGLYMVLDAATDPDKCFYQSTVNIEPNTDYLFSSEFVFLSYIPLQLSYSPIIKYYINSTQIGGLDTIVNVNCNWHRFTHIWNSGNNTTATIKLINHNIGGSGNDYAMDNVSLRKICKAYDTINIQLIDPSITPIDISIKVCENEFPYNYYDSVYYEAGNYRYIFSTDGEIDSTHVINITSFPIYNDTIFEYIYRGDRYMLDGFDENEEGIYANTYSSINGCDSNIYLSLNLIKLMFPNAVTANGDGVNDVFEIHSLLETDIFSDNELIIFNRQGDMIYSKKNIKYKSDFWDPQSTNSPTGTYFYRFITRNRLKDMDIVGVIEVLK